MWVTACSELRTETTSLVTWSTVSKKGQHDSLQNMENYSLISFHVAPLSLPGHAGGRAARRPQGVSSDTGGHGECTGPELPGNADHQAFCLPLPQMVLNRRRLGRHVVHPPYAQNRKRDFLSPRPRRVMTGALPCQRIAEQGSASPAVTWAASEHSGSESVCGGVEVPHF